ncbi:unnamed protein product [Eretmochelys imbricata]
MQTNLCCIVINHSPLVNIEPVIGSVKGRGFCNRHSEGSYLKSGNRGASYKLSSNCQSSRFEQEILDFLPLARKLYTNKKVCFSSAQPTSSTGGQREVLLECWKLTGMQTNATHLPQTLK